jgi:hypothetical protein
MAPERSRQEEQTGGANRGSEHELDDLAAEQRTGERAGLRHGAGAKQRL